MEKANQKLVLHSFIKNETFGTLNSLNSIKRKGDKIEREKEDIISKLLINNYDKYYHIAYSYAQNKNDAQDIVQEGAYKAIYNSKKLRQVKYADTWICKIIINEAINYIKKTGLIGIEIL